MSKTNNSILNFFKRNVYYLIIAAALLITAIVILAVLLGKEPAALEVSKPTESVESIKPTTTSEKPDETRESAKPTDEPESTSEETKPTETKIVFATPVSDYTVSKEFTSATVVYNKTLGVYTGHMGIDFSAEAGAEVCAAYGGTVESVRLLSDESNVYHVVVKDLSGGTVDFKTSKLSLYTKTSGLKKGDVVSGTAKFYKKKYSFDDLYSIENNVSFFASEPIVSLERVRSSFSTSEFVAESVIKAVLNSLNTDEAGVVIALILGRTDYIRKELLSRFTIEELEAISSKHLNNL